MRSIIRIAISAMTIFSLANCGQNGFSSQASSDSANRADELMTAASSMSAGENLTVQSTNKRATDFSDIVGIPVQINYIVKLYKNVLRRTPSKGEVQFWATTYRTSPLTCMQITRYFVKSSESQGIRNRLLSVDVVPYLYVATFDRPVDSGGYQYWTNLLNTGALNREQIADHLLTAPELGNVCLSNGLLP